MLSAPVPLLEAACAVLVAVSWSLRPRLDRAFRIRDCLSFAAWGALTAVGQLAVTLGSGWVDTVGEICFWLAAGFGLAGIAGALRLVARRRVIGAALAEAAVVGSCLVSLLWVAVGAPDRARGQVLGALAVALVGSCALAMLLRLPAGACADVEGRHRGIVRGAAVVLLLLVGQDVLDLLGMLQPGVPWLRGRPPQWPGAALSVTASLVAAAVPWLPAPAEQEVPAPGRVARGLPYLLVAGAVATQCAAAFAGHSGPISLALVALVVSSLVAVQGFSLVENRRLLVDLEASQARLVALLENAGDVILGIDVGGRVLSCSAASERLLNRTPQAVQGREVTELAIDADREAVRTAVAEVAEGRTGSARVELRLAAPGTGTVELRLRRVPGGVVANLSDVTDAVRLRERLERLARFDDMTGLANRSHLLEQVGGWLRLDGPVTLLYADLDGFKAVNDRFGHLRGDLVLVEVARRIEAAVALMGAERSLVARMGGDEFVVALLGVQGSAAVAAAKRLPAALRPSFRVADRNVRIGASVGVAGTDDELPDSLDPQDPADLLHRADVAMFAAKQGGRSTVVRWNPDMEEQVLRRVDIAIGLRRALDSGQLALAYQPIVRLSDGAVIGVEALIRVHGGDDAPGALSGLSGIVSPAELIEVAETTGEIGEMGEWVLTEATQRSRQWRDLGHDLFVGVNMSVRQLAADGFVDSVRTALADSGLPPHRLVVEITEGQLLSERDPGWLAVEALRGLGVRLFIDDFGSGYSSLSYLRRMPVRAVKIDKALLEGAGTDPRATTLLRAVIGAVRALGLLVVAEGMETMAMVRLLRDLGAYAGQGYALFEALTPEALLEVLDGPPVDFSTPADRRRGSLIAGPGLVSPGTSVAVHHSSMPDLI